MKKKICYFMMVFALFCVGPTPFVYGEEQENKTTEATKTPLDNEENVETIQDEIVLVGDVQIDGLIFYMGEGEGFPQEIKEDQIIINIATGTKITQELLPSRAAVSLKYDASLGEEGQILPSDTANFQILWDLSELGEVTQTLGTITLQGRWGACEQQITGGAVDIETFKPVCEITVEEVQPIQLPEAIYFHKEELNVGSPYEIKISKQARRVMIILNQKYLSGTEFSVEAVDANTGEAVPLVREKDYTISTYDHMVKMLNLQNFFQDDKVYEIVLNQKNGGQTYKSNTMILNMMQGDAIEGVIPPSGGNNDDNSNNDDSMDIPRDGSGRKAQEGKTGGKKFSVTNINTLLKSNKEEAIVILDAGKVYLGKNLLEDYAKEEKSLEVDLKKTKENAFTLRILEAGKEVSKLTRSVKIKVPLGQNNSLTKDLTAKEKENLLVAKVNGKIIPTAYFDSETDEMVIITANTGTVTITKGEAIEFTDIQNHWSRPVVNFASNRGIAQGYTNQTFYPDKKITGSEFTTFLMRNLPEGVMGPESEKKLKNAGTDQYITREKAAELIYVAVGELLKETQGSTDFTDLKATSAETTQAIQAIQRAGIMQGRGGRSFAPKEVLSRSEALTTVINTMKVL